MSWCIEISRNMLCRNRGALCIKKMFAEGLLA